MKRRFQALLFSLRHLGLLGWVGAMLSVSSLAYAAIVVPQQREEMESTVREMARLQRRLKAIETAPRSPADGRSQANSATELPTVKTTPEALLKLDAIARKDKLLLKRNAYTYVEQAANSQAANARNAPAAAKPAAPAPRPVPVVEVRIAVPVTGKYGDLRAFVAHATESLPTLALEGMSLNRESIAQSEIQAQMRFTLFVKREL